LDHLLVEIWLRVKLKKNYYYTLKVIDRYVIEKLEDENIHKNYVRIINANLKEQQIIHKNVINKTWNQVRDTVRQAAKTILQIKKNGKKPWFDKVCEYSAQKRKEVRE